MCKYYHTSCKGTVTWDVVQEAPFCENCHDFIWYDDEIESIHFDVNG